MERRTGTPIEKWDDVNGKSVEQSAVSVNDMSQGERFIQLRESTGMNRKDFADYLGIPYRTMQDWEHDVRTMPDYVFALIEYKVTAEFGLKLPQELDLSTIGNVRRGLEDQLEQNDNMIGDGIISNIAPQNPVENMKDDNANGVPDEQEELGTVASHEKSKPFHVSVAAKEEKTSLLKELRDCIPEPSDRPHRVLHPELVL